MELDMHWQCHEDMVVDWDHSFIDEWNSVKHIRGWNGGQYPTFDELGLNLCKSDFHDRLKSPRSLVLSGLFMPSSCSCSQRGAGMLIHSAIVFLILMLNTTNCCIFIIESQIGQSWGKKFTSYTFIMFPHALNVINDP